MLYNTINELKPQTQTARNGHRNNLYIFIDCNIDFVICVSLLIEDNSMDLTASVTTVEGIGPAVAGKLEKLDIKTVFDLLYHLPFRYEDRSLVSPISQIQPGEMITVSGRLVSIKNEYSRRGKVLQKGIVEDDTGRLTITWFNQSYLVRSLREGEQYAFYGKADFFGKTLTLISPDYEVYSQDSLHTGRIVPVYPETAGLTSKWLRQKINHLLNQLNIEDFIPNKQPVWKTSLCQIHFPGNMEKIEFYRSRLAFDEILLLQLKALQHREQWKNTRLSHKFEIDRTKLNRFLSSLPFTLTQSQSRSIEEILADLSKDTPMNRLLEGDVGSGKTVVAAAAIYATFINNYQTLVLAPTQILANQHFDTFNKFMSQFGLEVGLVTANTKKFDPKNSIIVGTHALLSEKINLDHVGLVIIDEQHRFGVKQRAAAAARGTTPHILTMTATPIPRTIALAMYGDLDLSVLTELPQGRKPVKTWVVPESKRQSSYRWITDQLTTGNSQCFWVCPFIDESESMKSVKAASVEFESLKEKFPNHILGLLHGKMKAREKDEVLGKFKEGNIDILVATPVVEVGIDIPNASIMVIEAAERFGLAQLHQLRGRVGRNDRQAYCLLFSPNPTGRLRAMENHNLGSELAEIDMKLRGPGDIYGISQHGLPKFKVARFEDIEITHEARKTAENLLNQLPKLPLLRSLVENGKIGLVQPN
jgi:ATP-dependent DNA helicase RecG